MKKNVLFGLLMAATAFADATVSGQITDSRNADGGVIEFAILRLAEPEDLNGDPIPVTTDRTGRFSIKLAPGSYRLGDIRKPQEKEKRFFEANYARDAFDVGGDPGYDLGIIRLEKTGTFVTGKVTRAGKPAAGVVVEAFQPGLGMPTGATAVTNKDGGYEMQMPEVKSAQPVVVRVEEKDGSAFGRAEVGLWKAGAIDLALPGAYHELLVDVAAPGDAILFLHPAGDPAPYYMHKTKGSAKVTIPGMPPGAWTVTGLADGIVVSVEVTIPSKEPVPLRLPGGKRVRLDGKVTLTGLPKGADASRLVVYVRPAAAGPAAYLWTPLQRDGSFAFPGLAEGSYELSLGSGAVFESMRYFRVSRSIVLQAPVELKGGPRTLELTARAESLFD